MKTCTKCKQLKPLSDYYVKNCRKSGKQAYCKKCHTTATNRSRQKAIDATGITLADQARWRKYKITKEQFAELNIKQDYCCAICGIKPTKRVLDVDHYHKTGIIRGLLCNACNRMLSNCRDDIDILASGISYLINSY